MSQSTIGGQFATSETTFSPAFPAPPGAGAPPPAPEGRKGGRPDPRLLAALGVGAILLAGAAAFALTRGGGDEAVTVSARPSPSVSAVPSTSPTTAPLTAAGGAATRNPFGAKAGGGAAADGGNPTAGGLATGGAAVTSTVTQLVTVTAPPVTSTVTATATATAQSTVTATATVTASPTYAFLASLDTAADPDEATFVVNNDAPATIPVGSSGTVVAVLSGSATPDCVLITRTGADAATAQTVCVGHAVELP